MASKKHRQSSTDLSLLAAGELSGTRLKRCRVASKDDIPDVNGASCQDRKESVVNNLRVQNDQQDVELRELRQQLNELQQGNAEVVRLRKQNAELKESQQRLKDEFETICEDMNLSVDYVKGLDHAMSMAICITEARNAQNGLISFMRRLRQVFTLKTDEITNAIEVLGNGVSFLYWIHPLLHFISTGDSSLMDDRVDFKLHLSEKIASKSNDEH